MEFLNFKKNIIISTFCFIIVNNVWADASKDLKSRLDKINSFYATFTQKVTDSNGNILQEGQGELWVKRPNLFNWHIMQPDESLLVSDGKSLWFYNPFVGQTTITWLKDVIQNTPFMLITYNQTSNWHQYIIKQIGDNFTLTPKTNVDNLRYFVINVSSTGIIHQFSTIELDNHTSSYYLNLQCSNVIDTLKFTFVPPQNVTVDDQRK